MDEDVLAAILRLDETITLGRIKKLHRTSDAHVGIPFPKKAWIGRSCIGPHARPCISDVGRQTALWASSKTAILRTYPQIGVHRLRGYMGQDRGGSKANRAALRTAPATPWTAIRPVTAVLEPRPPGLKLSAEPVPSQPAPQGARHRRARNVISPAGHASFA